MKNKLTFLAIAFLFIAKFSNAQWTHLAQPYGGYCWAIERVGGEIWAGYNYGIYVSANDGVTWTKHPTLNYPTMDIETVGDTVILLIQESAALFVTNLETVTSYDGGVTWNAPVIAETSNSYYTYGDRRILVTDSSLVINSNSDDFYVSYDYGQSWDTLFMPTGWGNLVTHTNKYLLCYSYNPAATYFSTNGGATWNFLDSNYVTSQALIIDSTFYFSLGSYDSVYHYFIARTSDFGQTWDTLEYDALTGPGQLFLFNGKIYYFYYPYPQPPVQHESADGGNTWTPSALPFDLSWLEDDRAVLLYSWEFLVNTTGLYRYNPATNIYYHTETGINAQTMTFLKNNNGVLYAKNNNGILYRSADAGTTWNTAPAFVDGSRDFIFMGDTIFGSTLSSNFPNKLCYSYNNGITWDSVQFINGTHWKSPACMAELNDKLYIANSNYTAVSNDWGATWDSISTFEDFNCFASGMYGTQMAVCNNELYIMDDNHDKISKFDTITQTWKRKFCFNTPGVQYDELAALGDKIVLSGAYKFYVSSDSGNTWLQPARNGLPVNGSNIFAPTSLTSIDGVWFGACLGNMYYSFDYGNNWQLYPTDSGMSLSNASRIITSLNGTLYAGGNGIWRDADTLALITGNVYFDNNNNGLKDGGETGVSNSVVFTSPNNIAFNTDNSGNYAFLTSAIGDTLRASPPTNFCSVNPAFYLTNGAAGNNDFGIYFYPGIQDLSVDITNRNPFRPGFNTKIDATVKNNGTVALAGQMQVVLDSNLFFINSSVVPSQINGDTLIFSLDTLHLLETEKITIETQTPFSVALTTPIICSATIFPVAGDTIPADNYSQFNTTVVGSFDPNDKSSLCGDYFTPAQVQNGEEMVYTIRFQNMGNFQADNIHITDTLSELFDLQSFRIISSSHSMYYTIAGNGIVNFYFGNIFLPAAITDEPGSHGFVKFAVKCKSTISIGTGIDNTAYIYFDFNQPVKTNIVSTLIADPPLNLNIEEVNPASHLSIFPNPASGILNGIIASEKNYSFDLAIYNTLGKSVAFGDFKSNHFAINVSDLPDGLYYGKIIIPEINKQLFFRFMVIK